jgi:hypothetical protein
MSSRRIIIAGGSGFIGRALTRELVRQGFVVTVLTRAPRPRSDGVTEVLWQGAEAGSWAGQLDGAEAVINLAGQNINCPHTPANLRGLASSRVNSVNALAAAIGAAAQPPRVWVQASAVGFYGDEAVGECDENIPAGQDPLAKICQQWEAAVAAVNLPATRKVVLRIGFVLGREGGALPLLGRLTRCFLGGTAGHGRQYISWIHLADLVAMFVAAVTDENLAGTYNAVAPQPVPNAEFMRALRRALHRPWSPPVPALAVRLGARLMGSEGSLALASQRCVPRRFQAAGFRFQFADLPTALRDLCQ